MPAIQQQTWDEVQALIWGDLEPHLWMDFRISLLDGIGEVEVQGVKLVASGASIEGLAAAQIQGVRVEYGLVKITNEVEIIVSCSVAKKDYYMAMKNYLPLYHHQARLTTELLKIYAKEFKRLEHGTNDIIDNRFVDSTISNIDRWEKILGIKPDITKPYSFRRERIKSKLRAVGTVTKTMIQNVAAAFSNGEVEVIEDNANYKFTVKFVGVKGIPENMDDLTTILNEVKPAHLAFEYSYTYNTWDFSLTKTWGDVATLTWDEMQTFS